MGKSTTDDFALKHKRENDLPLSLVDCKLLDFPWAQDRHYKYEINSMVLGSRSKQYLPIQKSEISAQTLEMTNYALNPTQVKKVAKSKKEIDPRDLVLLTPKGSSDVQKSRPIVPWLRRTEYVSSESKQYGKASTMSKQKQRSRLSVEDIIEDGRARVEHTFNAAAKVQLSDLKHPAGLKATEILPVFPDFEFWPNVYTLAAFDEDPCRRWDVVIFIS
jgi:RNA polymerase II-associated factor 1